MEEHVEMPAGAGPRFVEETRAAGLQALDSGGQVRDLEGDVMKALAMLCNELPDYGIGRSCLEKFDSRVSGRQHRNIHVFVCYRFAQTHRQAKLVLVEAQGFVERSHGDAEVVDLKF